MEKNDIEKNQKMTKCMQNYQVGKEFFKKKQKQTNSDRSEKAHFAKVTDVEADNPSADSHKDSL